MSGAALPSEPSLLCCIPARLHASASGGDPPKPARQAPPTRHAAATTTQGCDEGTLGTLRELARHERCVAIGECGLDFNRNFSPPEVQASGLERDALQLVPCLRWMAAFVMRRDHAWQWLAQAVLAWAHAREQGCC